MAKVKDIEMGVVVKLSLWSAIKLRIAGVNNYIEKERGEEAKKVVDVNDVRINSRTGRPEVCIAVERVGVNPKEPNTVWVDYEEDLWKYTLGACPNCGDIYRLRDFRAKAIEKIKEIKEC